MDSDLRRALAGGLEGMDEGFDEEEDEGSNWLNDDFVLQATIPDAGQVSSGWEGDAENVSFICVRVLALSHAIRCPLVVARSLLHACAVLLFHLAGDRKRALTSTPT